MKADPFEDTSSKEINDVSTRHFAVDRHKVGIGFNQEKMK